MKESPQNGWLDEKQGVKKVIVYALANCSETVITMLATSALGAIFSSCSSDFGVEGVIDRFEQIEPKIMIAANGYLYNGKVIDRSEELNTISKRLPSWNTSLLLSILVLQRH